jgi:hypothetical protein
MEPIGVPMDRFQHAACWTMLRLFTDAAQVAGLAPRWIAAPGRRSFTRAATPDLGAGYFDRRDSTKIAIVFDVGSKQPAA